MAQIYRPTGLVRKRTHAGRIIKTEIRKDGREWQLHSTKGWRSYRKAS